MPTVLPSSFRGYLSEPAVPDPPARVWRDWALVAVASVTAVLEALLRTDAEWVALPLGWQLASVVAFAAVVPAAILYRRTHPLLATALGFGVTVAFGLAVAAVYGPYGGLVSVSVILVVPYSLYRWGSGRDGAIGGLVLVAAGVLGNLTAPAPKLSDWIGGFIVLSIPVELGLTVRYRTTAQARAISEAKTNERVELARELHDTVAHHVSAIAVQAQAGRAVAATDPQRALQLLEVIEEAASRTLDEMRTMVSALRSGSEADLAPNPGLTDLRRLAGATPIGHLAVEVDVAADLGPVGPTIDAAIYRIAQESVTNAIRHARRATRVEVRVVPAGDLIRLTVIDDGEPSGTATGLGFGLLGMAERANLLGGRLSAGPNDGRGWRVVAEIPRTGARA